MKKIPTCFHRPADAPWGVVDQWHPACLWVRDGEGVATVKIDGSACAMRDGRYYRRREVKPGKPTPAGFVQVDARTDQHGAEVLVGWVPVDFVARADVHHATAFAAWRGLHGAPPPDGTYELIGPSERANPYGLTAPQLLPHATDGLAVPFPPAVRTFAKIGLWLGTHVVEGLVYHHPDGRMAKCKRKDFGWEWPVPGHPAAWDTVHRCGLPPEARP